MPVDPPERPVDDPRAPEPDSPQPLARTATLRFVPTASGAPGDDTTVVVLDTTWTAPATDGPGDRVVGLRDVVARILAERDLIAEAFARLDEWADASGIVATLSVDDTSFWHGARLEYWMWLLDEHLWIAAVDALLDERPHVGTIDCAAGTDVGLIDAARLIAARDGLVFRDETPVEATTPPVTASTSAAVAWTPAVRPRRPRSLPGRILWRIWPPELERRRRSIVRRLATLAGEPESRLLVVQAHVRQRIETPTGPRFINPYLGPIVDRLRGTRLDPIEVDIRGDISDETVWRRLRVADAVRTLPSDVLAMNGPTVTRKEAQAIADAVGDRVAAGTTPLLLAGIDLGPALTARVAMRTRRTAFLATYDVPRIRALIRRLRPAGILLADEYHRQDWLAAAADEGVPTVAVQHGVIYRWHNGYIHQSRPPQLRLPDRTYVFGEWERTLLTTMSAYRPDEVRVGGSPRLDLLDPAPVDREAVRRELGVAPGDRLVVLSGTWGRMYRRFHYPIALAGLFARPTDRVHLVVKLHPSERDEGPYRSIIDALAAAGGFRAPTVSTVQSIDLYRLLAAADAHLGIHSTLLTEAVVTATPNLLATGLVASDLLGYVDAGVAIPVRDADGLAAALERPRADAMRPDDREAFLRAHFEPGLASQRIADDLLEWLR